MEDINIPTEVLLMEVVPNLPLYDLYHLTTDANLLQEELGKRQNLSDEYLTALEKDDANFLCWLLSSNVPYPKTEHYDDVDNLIDRANNRCLLALIEQLPLEQLKNSILAERDLDRLFPILLESDTALKKLLQTNILGDVAGLSKPELEWQILDRIIAIQGYIPKGFFGGEIRIDMHSFPQDVEYKQYIKKFVEYIDYIK